MYLQLKLSGNDRRIFDEVFFKYGDGFVCPVGPWFVYYWSPRVLRLSPQVRSQLFSLAVLAAQQLMRLTKKKRFGKSFVNPLSAREIEVLRLYSIGHRPRAIAQQLGIKEMTIREQFKHAQRKLDAKHVSHAIALALRRYWI